MSKKRVALLSNVTVDLVAARLQRAYDFYLPQGYDTWVQEVLDPASPLHSCNAEASVVLLDGTEARSWRSMGEAAERISAWKRALVQLTNEFTTSPVFITTIDFRINRIRSFSERAFHYEMQNDWYEFAQGLAEAKTNVYVIDLFDTITDLGRNTFYSNKLWYLSSMPFSRDGLTAVARQIDRALAAVFKPRKKIIVLDLDNTLWGGVAAEDGVEGIELANHKEGQRYYDFQRQLKEMKGRGTVLGVVSKNNPEDAEAVIGHHPAMLLHDEDFVSKRINWESKALNLKDMSSELNIMQDGFVFVDDNPIEREIIKGELPEVTVPDFPEDSSELLSFAEELWFDCFQPLRVLSEDLQKTQMYQTEAKRQRELNESLNLDDYLVKLGLKAVIHRVRPEELDRVTQLCNKTNQFNVTTKRYTREQIEKLADNPNNIVYVVYSSDQYGASGLVAVVILVGKNDYRFIDTFLMSCRVMGRKLEDVIMNEIATVCSGKLLGEYIPTGKNKPVEGLYDRLGFALLAEDNDGRKLYELNTDAYRRQSFGAYQSIEFEA